MQFMIDFILQNQNRLEVLILKSKGIPVLGLTFNSIIEGFFSEKQTGFQEGVGYIKASFVKLYKINHMLERRSKISTAFLIIAKHLTVWIDGLFFKLFKELGINGTMRLVIKDLWTNAEAGVLYSGPLPRMFDISQGNRTRKNGLSSVLSTHCFAIFVNELSFSSPSFADI